MFRRCRRQKVSPPPGARQSSGDGEAGSPEGEEGDKKESTAAMVHSAYDSVEVVRGCPSKIEVAGVHGSKILTGCSDCSLRIYAPASPSSPASDTSGRSAPYEKELQRESYVLERTVSGFWKKGPVAMEVSRSRDLLLSLSEWIAFHRLPNLETVAAIGKTKGANVYSWDDQRGFLCVGRQKKVGIFRFDGKFYFFL